MSSEVFEMLRGELYHIIPYDMIDYKLTLEAVSSAIFWKL